MRGGNLLARVPALATRYAVRYAPLVVTLSVLLTVALGYYTARRLNIDTDTADMISSRLEWRQDFIEFREAFPQRYRTILLVVNAPDAIAADEATRELVERLEAAPETVEDVFAPGVGEFFSARALLYLDLDALETLAERLTAAQPLIGRLREDFSSATLFSSIALAAERGETDALEPLLPAIAGVLEALPAGEAAALDWAGELAPEPEGGAGGRRFVNVKPVLDFSRPRAARGAMETVREAAASIERNYEGVTVGITGTVALEDEELVSVTRGAGIAGLLSLAMVTLVLMLALRSLRLLAAGVFALLAGLTGTAAFAAWAVGSLNLISVAFAVLYIGLGIDFILHYTLRVRELCARGEPVAAALETAAGDVGGSLVICAVTTALGFFSFVPTSFSGISQLGLISGTGMFVSLVASLTLLPALIALTVRDRETIPPRAASWTPGERLSSVLQAHRPILIAFAALAVGAAVLLPGVSFDNNPMRLRDPATESVRTYLELANDPDAAPSTLSVLLAPERDRGEAIDRLEALPSVDRVISLESFVPENQQDKRELLADTRLVLGPGFADFPAGPETDPERTRRELANAAEALAAGAAEGPAAEADEEPVAAADEESATARFIVAAERYGEYLDRLEPAALETAVRGLDAALLGELPAEMRELAERLSPPRTGLQDLPEQVVSRWRLDDGRELLEVAPALDIATDPEAERRFVEEVREIAPRATGLPVVHIKAGETVVAAFREAFAFALGAITLLLLVFMRSLRATLVVLVPVLAAALYTAAATLPFGLSFNFANIIALPLLLGIGVDNGIHMLHRARNASDGDGHVLATSTSRAVLYSGLTTLASFGNLAISSHRGMSSMGELLAIGLIATMLTTLILLPAIIAWRRA